MDRNYYCNQDRVLSSKLDKLPTSMAKFVDLMVAKTKAANCLDDFKYRVEFPKEFPKFVFLHIENIAKTKKVFIAMYESEGKLGFDSDVEHKIGKQLLLKTSGTKSNPFNCYFRSNKFNVFQDLLWWLTK